MTSRLSVSQYNWSLLFCIPNVNFLSYTVVEISLRNNVEKKEKWINLGKTKQKKTGSHIQNATIHSQFSYQALTFYL